MPGCAGRHTEIEQLESSADPTNTGDIQRVAGSWQADPLGRHQYRWWDGTVWTDHVADAGRAGIDPLQPAPPPPAMPSDASRALPNAIDLSYPSSSAYRATQAAVAPASLAGGGRDAHARLPHSFAGLNLLGHWVQGLLIATGALFGVSAIMVANAWTVFASWISGDASVSESVVADDAYWSVVAFAFLAMIPTMIVFIVWMFRYWTQLFAVKANATPKRRRGWTVGGWFIPVGNLWIPKQIVDDYWRTTSEFGANSRGQKVSPLVHWWWAAWLAGGLMRQIGGAVDPTNDSTWHTFYLTSLLAEGLWAIGAVLAALVVGKLVKRLSAIAGL